MQLTSSAFQDNSRIPTKFTCDGENCSPELFWRNAPSQARSYALIMHDPDAPRPGGFTHWVLYDIPATVSHIEPGIPSKERVADAGTHGRNDSGKIGYMGPCPPSGTHRYYIRLYALDSELNLAPGVRKDELELAMTGHVLEKAELMGTYARAAKKAA